MSPILVRPVREQLEHDRVIRLLQVRLKKKLEVAANIGLDQTVPVKIGQVQIYPDLVLTTADKSRRLVGTVEVETAESVNHLEAMAQWAHLGRAKAPFHLYVPVGSVDSARRLAAENGVNLSELWSFHTIGDQTRFTLVDRTSPADVRKVAAARASSGLERTGAGKARPAAARKSAKPPVRTARPASKKAAKTSTSKGK